MAKLNELGTMQFLKNVQLFILGIPFEMSAFEYTHARGVCVILLQIIQIYFVVFINKNTAPVIINDHHVLLFYVIVWKMEPVRAQAQRM